MTRSLSFSIVGDRNLFLGNTASPNRYWRVNTLIIEIFMTVAIASILNLVGPDMIVVLLTVLLLFGAKKLPELARGMGRAVKEFSAARDEIEKGLSQSGPTLAAPRAPASSNIDEH